MIPGPYIVIACPYCDGLGRVRTALSGNNFGARVRSDGRLFAPGQAYLPSILICNACDALFSLDRANRVGEIDRLDEDEGRPEWRAAERLREPDAERCLAGLALNPSSDQVDEKTLRILAMWKVNDLADQDPFRSVKGPAVLALFTGPVAIAMGVDTAMAAVSEHQATNPAITGAVLGGVTLLMLAIAWLQPPAGKLIFELPQPEPSQSRTAASLENLEALISLLESKDEEEKMMLADVYRQLGRFDEGVGAAEAIDSPDLLDGAKQILALCKRGETGPHWLDPPGEEGSA